MSSYDLAVARLTVVQPVVGVMIPRDALPDYESTNGALGWLVIGVLLVTAVMHALTDRVLWAGLALVVAAVAMAPPMVTRRLVDMIAWEVLAFAALPIIGRSFDVFVELTSSLALAALALVVVVELDAYTAVEMTPEVAVGFVVVATMAVTGFWTVAAYAADIFLGTSVLGTQTELMWDIVTATGVGVIVGFAFEFYVRRVSAGHAIARKSWGEPGDP